MLALSFLTTCHKQYQGEMSLRRDKEVKMESPRSIPTYQICHRLHRLLYDILSLVFKVHVLR
jgi:hypothetical protein